MDVNKIAVDDVIGIVDSLAVVPATVIPVQKWDLEVRVVGVRGDGAQWNVLVRAVPLKRDRWSATNTTDKMEMISFRDFCQVWDDGQCWFGERHCGKERD